MLPRVYAAVPFSLFLALLFGALQHLASALLQHAALLDAVSLLGRAIAPPPFVAALVALVLIVAALAVDAAASVVVAAASVVAAVAFVAASFSSVAVSLGEHYRVVVVGVFEDGFEKHVLSLDKELLTE